MHSHRVNVYFYLLYHWLILKQQQIKLHCHTLGHICSCFHSKVVTNLKDTYYSFHMPEMPFLSDARRGALLRNIHCNVLARLTQPH